MRARELRRARADTPRAGADRASPHHAPTALVSPTRGAARICARVAEDDADLGLNTRTENPKLTVRFTRIQKPSTRGVQARQEEAFVQPGGVDVRQGFGKRFGVNAGERSDDPSALNIYEATERSTLAGRAAPMRDSALEYELKLYNGANVRALIYLVYAEPLTGAKAPGQTPALGLNGAPLTDDGGDNAWLPVTRARCAKGCAGPSSRRSSASESRVARRRGARGGSSPTRGRTTGRTRATCSSASTRRPTRAQGTTSARFSGASAFFLSIRRTVVFPQTQHGRTVARFAKLETRIRFFDEKRRRNDEKTTDAFAPAAPPLRDATDFCSGSSPRTATLSWAAASPAPSASSPTTTCPRVRRASASDAQAEARARPLSPLLRPRFYNATRDRTLSPPGPRGTSPGIPGAPAGPARARPGTGALFDIPLRPRAPRGAPRPPPPPLPL